MIYGALAIFVVVFLGGIFMMFKLFQDEEIPLVNAMGHGLLAVIGLLVLYVAASDGDNLISWVAFFLYIGAAAGGLTLATIKRVLKKEVPKWLAVAHACTACAGCLAISIAVYQAVV